jgi:hypothetical protein
MIDVQRIQALLELGWSYRRIERETGVRWEPIASYDPRHVSNAANESTGSAVEPYRKEVEVALSKALSARRIWQDLRVDYGFGYNYAPVKRFVHSVKNTHREVADVMEHLPGNGGQAASNYPDNDAGAGDIYSLVKLPHPGPAGAP